MFKHQASNRNKPAEAARQSPNAPATSRRGAPATGRKRTGKVYIPDTLPVELLAGLSSDEDEYEADEDGDAALSEDDASASRRKRRRKVNTVVRNLTRLDKAPQDQTIGSTIYRVSKKSDERMPPALRKYAKSTKALMLRRGRTVTKPKGRFISS